MKCFYSQCKLGGEVDKTSAIKYNSKYYHVECYNKKINKEKTALLLKEKGFVAKTINMALKNIIDDSGFDSEFVYYVTKTVIENKKELNNPFGLKYYMQNFELINNFKKLKRYQEIEKMKNQKIVIDEIEEPKFKKNKKPPKYLKIL
jgi:hypothetical protein